MSSPWERPELSDAEKVEQRKMRDRLVRAAMCCVDTLAIDHRNDLLQMTSATAHRLLVEAAIGALIDSGAITEVDPNGPWVVRPELPEHLRPNVIAEIERYQRMKDVY